MRYLSKSVLPFPGFGFFFSFFLSFIQSLLFARRFGDLRSVIADTFLSELRHDYHNSYFASPDSHRGRSCVITLFSRQVHRARVFESRMGAAGWCARRVKLPVFTSNIWAMHLPRARMSHTHGHHGSHARVSWFWFLAELRRFSGRLLQSRAREKGSDAAATAGIFTTVRLTAQLKQPSDNKQGNETIGRKVRRAEPIQRSSRDIKQVYRAYRCFKHCSMLRGSIN
jgi:hypothetical protein